VVNNTEFPAGPVAVDVEPIIDNERIAMWDVTWSPDHVEPMRFYGQPVVVMFVTDAEVEWTEANGRGETRTYQAGQVQFLPAGRPLAPRSVRGPAHVILVALKGGGQAACWCRSEIAHSLRVRDSLGPNEATGYKFYRFFTFEGSSQRDPGASIVRGS
jgi:hypothetical protein